MASRQDGRTGREQASDERLQADVEATSIADFTAFFKAFCNSTRAGIVEQLMSGEKCVCEIVAHVGGSVSRSSPITSPRSETPAS